MTVEVYGRLLHNSLELTALLGGGWDAKIIPELTGEQRRLSQILKDARKNIKSARGQIASDVL